MKYEYLLFNLVIFASPIAGMLLVKKSIWPNLKAVIFSILPMASIFIGWDLLATGNFWNFNSKYVMDVLFFNLPIEEVLFFLTVPYASLVLWVNIKQTILGSVSIKYLKTLVLLGLFVFLLLAIITSKLYSMIVFLLSFYALLTVPSHVKKSSLVFVLIIIMLTTIFNGYLTSRPVVLYNPEFLTNIRLFTIPIEDYFYGFLLLMGVVFLYEKGIKKYGQ